MTIGPCVSPKGSTSPGASPAIATCGPGAIRSRAARRRSCATPSPSASSACRRNTGSIRTSHSRIWTNERSAVLRHRRSIAGQRVPHDFSAVWHALAADLGMAGLLVPEQLGGAGASAREAAVVMEEIGRAIAPVPFLSSAVLATVALLEASETETATKIATETVSELAQGAATAALVVPLSTAPGDP